MTLTIQVPYDRRMTKRVRKYLLSQLVCVSGVKSAAAGLSDTVLKVARFTPRLCAIANHTAKRIGETNYGK